MATVLERVQHLIALATSPNEHEARSAAHLAVTLIRKHRIVLSMPPATPAPSGRRKSDPRAERAPKRARSSGRGVKRVADPPEKIVAPLGGECVACGGRYRADQTIYWFASGGGMHPKCFEEWSRG